MSSGYSHDPISADFGSYGFAGSVAKPYSMTEFAQILNAVVSLRSSQD